MKRYTAARSIRCRVPDPNATLTVKGGNLVDGSFEVTIGENFILSWETSNSNLCETSWTLDPTLQAGSNPNRTTFTTGESTLPSSGYGNGEVVLFTIDCWSTEAPSNIATANASVRFKAPPPTPTPPSNNCPALENSSFEFFDTIEGGKCPHRLVHF